jgi:hypothetical protein
VICRERMTINTQLLFGISIGLVISGAICLITLFAVKYINKNKVVQETDNELPPVHVLEVGDNGLWYIKCMSSKGTNLQVVDSEHIEEIIGDFVSAQITDYRPFYNFDIKCSSGDEYSVIAEKKTAIDNGRNPFWDE